MKAGPVAETIVLADAHLGAKRGDIDDFLSLLADLEEHLPARLVMAGDMFHYLIGDAKFVSPGMRAVLEGFARLRQLGTDVVYIEGNRDFFVKRFLAPYVSSAVDAASLTFGGRRYHFIHGDRINTRDIPYRFWRLLSKSPFTYAAVKLLPAGMADAFARRTEARLYRLNFKHKRRLPEEGILAYARQRWSAGDDVVVLGHFHRFRRFSENGRELVIAPPWLETRGYLRIDAAGTAIEVIPRPQRDHEDEPIYHPPAE